MSKFCFIVLLSISPLFGQATQLPGGGGGSVSSTSVGMPTANLLAAYPLLEGQGAYAYNSASAPQPNFNLIGPSEQVFSSAWFVNSGTATDYYATDPNGNLTASRLQITGGTNGYFYLTGTYPYTAGRQYTLSMYVASNTGSAQTVRIADDALNYTNKSIPATGWTRISLTFTAAGTGYVLPIKQDVATDAVDILVWGAQLEVGATATSYIPQVWTMARGGGPQNTSKQPSWNSAGYLDFTANSKQSYTQAFGWQTPMQVSTFSLYAVAKWSTTKFLSGYAPIFADIYTNNGLQLFGDNGNVGLAGLKFGNQVAYETGFNPNDNLWHVWTGTYDGTTLSLYMDGLLVSTNTVSVAPQFLKQLFLSNFNNVAYWPGQIASVYLYSVGDSASTVQTRFATLQALMTARGLTVTPTARLTAWEGDSITAGSFVALNLSYPWLAQATFSPMPEGRNFAASGSTLTDLNTRAAAVDALFASSTSTKKVLSVFIGANDLAGVAPATFVANLKTYCLARKAATPGLKIALATVLPRTLAGFNANRNTANTAILADPSFYDVIIPFAADPTVGCDACAANATYYSDGLHPTAAGQAIMGPLAATAYTPLY